MIADARRSLDHTIAAHLAGRISSNTFEVESHDHSFDLDTAAFSITVEDTHVEEPSAWSGCRFLASRVPKRVRLPQ
jgi:hypothetical protein